MNIQELSGIVCRKMSDEQDSFREWLLRQPPEEILRHAYEYSIREDIVMAMWELDLTDSQVRILLESPSPLDDIYRYVEKLDLGYMETIADSIRNVIEDRRRVSYGFK